MGMPLEDHDDGPSLSLEEQVKVTHAMLWLALQKLGYTNAELRILELQAVALRDQVHAEIRDKHL